MFTKKLLIWQNVKDTEIMTLHKTATRRSVG